MLWNKSDPNNWEPVLYEFPNCFDELHHSYGLNNLVMNTDGTCTQIPYEPQWYFDPEDFLKRYQCEEQNLIKKVGLREFNRDQARTAAHAFECLNKAWLPEHADYYREMNYPAQKWFLDTFYWHIIKVHLKWQAQYRCKRCKIHAKHTGQNSLALHHQSRSIVVEDGTEVSITGIEHLHPYLLEVLCDRCHWEAEHYG